MSMSCLGANPIILASSDVDFKGKKLIIGQFRAPRVYLTSLSTLSAISLDD